MGTCKPQASRRRGADESLHLEGDRDDERLRQGGFDDLDAAHLTVFQYPGPQGARPSELAARLRINKQALNYLLGDVRSKRVALTPRGTAAIGVIRDAVDEVETTWAQQLGPERFAQLRSLLLELSALP